MSSVDFTQHNVIFHQQLLYYDIFHNDGNLNIQKVNRLSLFSFKKVV